MAAVLTVSNAMHKVRVGVVMGVRSSLCIQLLRHAQIGR